MPIPASRVERGLFVFSALLGLWLAVAMPVFAQESYYWSYAQHPDLSYFDHPPMVAWLIWIGSHVLGDGALGIRIGTFLCGNAVVLTGFALLREFGADRRAQCAWLVLACCVPVLVVARFLANPDPPLAFFWLATMFALWRARGGHRGWWIVAGFAAGCALLSKYTAVFLAVGGVVVLLFDPVMRRQLRRPGPYVAVAVAAVTFSPVVIWNVANDFESFRFQTAGRWGNAQFGPRWLEQFVGGQWLVLNPVVALLLPASVGWLWRRARKGSDPRALWLLAFGAPMMLFLLGDSLFVQVKINWFFPAALPLLLGTAWWWSESGFELRRAATARWLRRLALAVGVVSALAPAIVFWPQHSGSTWTGWEEIAACAERWEEAIDDPDGLEGNVFFFAADYRDAAQLARHLKMQDEGTPPEEVLEPTLAQNVVGEPALQFDHWEAPSAHIGQDAVFVLPRPAQRDSFRRRVESRFDDVRCVEHVTVHRLGIPVLEADILVCRNYRGPWVRE